MFVRFLRDQRGNFTVLSAVMMVSLAGVAGLVADYGNGLYSRMEDQRIADTAAVAGARVYDETSSSSAATTAVDNVAALNGVSSNLVSESIVSSPTGDGNQAVSVSIRSAPALTFSRLLMHGPSIAQTLTVGASAFAEMKPGGAGCVIALSPNGTGVTLTGSGNISAANCAVASNQTINCHSSSNPIVTRYVYYDTSSLNCGSNANKDNWITAPAGYTLSEAETSTQDPLAGTSEVLGQTGRLSTVEAITSPSAPTVPSGTSLAFTSSNSSTITSALTAQGCTGSYASSTSTWTVSCGTSMGAGTYTFGTLSVASGTTVNFNVGGSSLATYNFAQVSSGGGKFNFGPGTYNIAQGILTTNGSSSIAMTFGAGTYKIGYPSSSTACNSSYYYSICWGAGSLTFAGPSTFVLAGGIYVKASTSVTMGSSGTTNSFNIGKAHDNNSLTMGGSAVATLGDTTNGSNTFQMAGNINLSSGGICMKIGAAPQHDINGYFLTAGGNVLGSGVYTVSQYVSLGGSNGGDVTCWGSDTGVNASGVTFVVGGTTLDGSGHAWYVGAGYSNVTITAPTSGTTQGLAVIGPTTSTNTGTALFTEGSTNNSISGAFYFPYGSITQNGASGINTGSGTGNCLEMIAYQVSITNGGAMASSCNIPGVGTSGASGLVSLVQ
ncbi:MAG TPA: pilus assembly protein TadG-related protein [Rhizomicrobium sp.]|nr:pilus assembly protein TadG-related protein [Rhizomicrobium sp.]